MNLTEKCKAIAEDIYKDLGSGWDEVIYHKAFEVALRLQGISYESKRVTPVSYKGHNIGEGEIDLLVKDGEEWLIIELKATDKLIADNTSQLNKYMRTLNIKNGILINFPQPVSRAKLECELASGVEYIIASDTQEVTHDG